MALGNKEVKLFLKDCPNIREDWHLTDIKIAVSGFLHIVPWNCACDPIKVCLPSRAWNGNFKVFLFICAFWLKKRKPRCLVSKDLHVMHTMCCYWEMKSVRYWPLSCRDNLDCFPFPNYCNRIEAGRKKIWFLFCAMSTDIHYCNWIQWNVTKMVAAWLSVVSRGRHF